MTCDQHSPKVGLSLMEVRQARLRRASKQAPNFHVGVCVCFLVVCTSGWSQERQVHESEIKTRGNIQDSEMAWQIAIADDFERTELGPDYVLSQGDESGWSIQHGVLNGKQVRSEHGAVIRRMLEFDDIDFECRFRFPKQDGYCRFNLVFDDSKEQSVHAGHICRVSVTRNSITLSDDKTGGMNKKIRALRQLSQRTALQQKELDQRLRDTTRKVAVALKEDWHTLKVQLIDSTMSIMLDGNEIAELDSPGIAHTTRDKLGFTVAAKIVEFDDVKVSIPHAIKN